MSPLRPGSQFVVALWILRAYSLLAFEVDVLWTRLLGAGLKCCGARYGVKPLLFREKQPFVSQGETQDLGIFS